MVKQAYREISQAAGQFGKRQSPRRRPVFLLSILCLLGTATVAQENKKIPLAQAAQHAAEQSQLTLPGSAPFHLKAHVADAVNASAEFTADIEEYWLSPTKWRRTIQSADFTQTLIVHGDKVSERNTGNYYPFWLRDLVTAMFGPLPMLEQLKRIPGVVDLPTDSMESSACVQMQVPSGTPELKTTLTYAFCFQGISGRLADVVTPGFRAHFQDYKPFKSKSVPRRIAFNPGPSINIEARIADLAPLTQVDEKLFAITENTPASEQLKSLQVGEPTAHALLLSSPELHWPSVREGKTSGIMSLYVSVDKTGHVREVWPFHADNPELFNAACQQVRQWQFKPYVNGVTLQMESVLTIAFEARQGPPIRVLSNAEARKLATHIVEPSVKTGAAARGTEFTLRAVVDEKGKLLEVRNPNHVKPALFRAGDRALHQWQFLPHDKDGAPDRFHADISFVVK